MPKISVLSPTYNHGKYVAAAVQSVLRQSYTNFEYIISDDASTDDTVAQIKGFADPRLTLITNEENLGTSLNSARCWQKASGDYIAWLTTDDIFETDALEILCKYLDDHPEHLAVFARCRFMNESGKFTGEEWKSDGVGLDRFQLLNTIFYHKHVFCPPTLMVRRQALEKIGYFPANLRQINDMALWIKLLFAGEVTILSNLILRFRQRDHELNISKPNAINLNRFAFEMTEVLELFTENITTFAMLTKIFPAVLEKNWPQEDNYVPFYLSQLALEFHHPSYWLYALRLLHKIFSSPELAQEIKTKFGFGYKEYFELTGKTRVIFDVEIANYKEHYQRVAAQQEETIKQLSAQIEHLNNSHNLPSRIAPLQKIKQFVRIICDK